MGDLVVGQNPKSNQWTMAGEVSAVTHRGRAYWIKFHEGGGRLFTRVDLKLDKSGVHGYTEAKMRQLEELWEMHKPETGHGPSLEAVGLRSREPIQLGEQGEGVRGYSIDRGYPSGPGLRRSQPSSSFRAGGGTHLPWGQPVWSG